MYDATQKAAIEEKDVGVGTLVWYKGFASQHRWDCPAVIYWVDPQRAIFRVMSLDDMRRQDQDYYIGKNPYGSNSQRDMRLASVAEVDAYLKAKGRRRGAVEVIAMAQDAG